jgi:hypothetical protein
MDECWVRVHPSLFCNCVTAVTYFIAPRSAGRETWMTLPAMLLRRLLEDTQNGTRKKERSTSLPALDENGNEKWTEMLLHEPRPKLQ